MGKRDMEKKIRQLEEQLSTSERVIGDLKMQCNDGRQRLKKATDEFGDLKKAYDDLLAKAEREDKDNAGKDRLIDQLRKELSQVSKEAQAAESKLANMKTIGNKLLKRN